MVTSGRESHIGAPVSSLLPQAARSAADEVPLATLGVEGGFARLGLEWWLKWVHIGGSANLPKAL